MQKKAELVIPLDRVRVAAVLAKYPVHRLSRQRGTTIEVREAGEDGEWTVRWRVSHNSDFGQPGPLAYKIDTLIINRKLDEAERPVPRVIRLGSLREIARNLGLRDHDTQIIKEALHQNASAYITAKIRYKGRDGSAKWIEIGGTRYVVVFAGERLPDGREADAVCLVLNDFYREILDTAQTRPLDYAFLRGLSPAAQRLYELLSYHMFGALKHGGRARMPYSEFCTYAPQTRCARLWEVRKQMEKLHAPHRKAGYSTGVEYEATTDRDGKPDWTMIYTPGPKAKAEFKAFTAGKSGPAAPQAELSLTDAKIETTPDPELEPEPTGLEAELVKRGVTRRMAVELVRDHPEVKIRSKLAVFDWLRDRRDSRLRRNPSGYLYRSIVDDYATPDDFEAETKRADRQATAQAKDDETRQTKARARAEQARIDAYLKSLSPEDRERIESEALAQADPAERADYEAEARPALRRMKMALIRDAHIRRVLDLPESD